MKLTGKRLYKKFNNKKLEEGLIVFTYSELNKKQKELYKKASVCGTTALVSSTIWGWSISSRGEKYSKYLAEIILDNFPHFDFKGKKFWFYNEQDINSNEYLIGYSSTMKNE